MEVRQEAGTIGERDWDDPAILAQVLSLTQ
jgi:hypothetical protein